jgi:prepilin-type N-terminal cleavage/methylation domain-containing protein
MSSKHTALGFSLIEVLVALTLFAIAVSAFTQSTFYALSSLQILQTGPTNDLDLRFVREHVLNIEDKEKIESGGTLQTLHSGEATWSITLEPTDILDLYAMTLSVEFAEGSETKDRKIEQKLYVLRPKWTDANDRKKALKEKIDKRNA